MAGAVRRCESSCRRQCSQGGSTRSVRFLYPLVQTLNLNGRHRWVRAQVSPQATDPARSRPPPLLRHGACRALRSPCLLEGRNRGHSGRRRRGAPKRRLTLQVLTSQRSGRTLGRSTLAGKDAMSTDSHIEVVLDYFDGCNTGDLDHLLRTLDDDVVHYFLPAVHPPIHRRDASRQLLAEVPAGLQPDLEDRPPHRERRRSCQRVELCIHLAEHRSSDDVPRLGVVRHEGPTNC